MQTILQARGDTAYTTEWDSAEQAALDSALARFPADRHPPLERYVRAAACLPKKYVQPYIALSATLILCMPSEPAILYYWRTASVQCALEKQKIRGNLREVLSDAVVLIEGANEL